MALHVTDADQIDVRCTGLFRLDTQVHIVRDDADRALRRIRNLSDVCPLYAGRLAVPQNFDAVLVKADDAVFVGEVYIALLIHDGDELFVVLDQDLVRVFCLVDEFVDEFLLVLVPIGDVVPRHVFGVPEPVVVDGGLEVAAVAPEPVVLRVEFADGPALRAAVQHVLRALRRVFGDVLLLLHTVLFIGVDVEVAAHRLIDLVFAHLSDLRLRVMMDNLSVDRALAALVSPPRDGQVTTGDAVRDESAARLFDEGRVAAGDVAGLPRVRDSGLGHQLDIDAPLQGLEHVVVDDIA